MKNDPGVQTQSAFAGLQGQRGITLIEALVLVLVIVILVVSIYIGVIYAEKQLLTNYRDRVATLVLSGELEMEYYRRSRNQQFELQVNRPYVLDYIGKDRVLTGYVTIEHRNGQEASNEQLLSFESLIATMIWRDPYTEKERNIKLREDYFLR